MKIREATSKKKDSTRRSIKECLGRHERAITFLGAMVVFCTFVTREGVREYLKEAADSVRSSEAKLDNFEMMSMVIGISSEPGEILEKTEALDEDRYDVSDKNDEDERKSALAKADDILDVRPFGRRQIMFWQYYYDQTPSTFDLLPMTKERKTEKEQLGKERAETIRGFNAIPRISKAELHNMSGKAQEDELDKIFEAYNVFSRAGVKYVRLLLRADDQILEEAHKKRDRAESWYKRSTVASYFLYTFGWGLGLLGKLYGGGKVSVDT